ncbi:hypothetical protein Bhyg_01123 [Pseudolycoriella hygida]|uniref:Uncharacterized protein n=1 Tax=Pseudolycoriella hygida TaxID=35572 RepID=A0A9Q0N940_9DIPT|nr:hypothetical protein Bhyg_01123 [Pseudolycoriella hygida]
MWMEWNQAFGSAILLYPVLTNHKDNTVHEMIAPPSGGYYPDSGSYYPPLEDLSSRMNYLLEDFFLTNFQNNTTNFSENDAV